MKKLFLRQQCCLPLVEFALGKQILIGFYENEKWTEANVIQARKKSGVYSFQQVWSNTEYVKANLYLGYIVK
jgi:hypothetical protein